MEKRKNKKTRRFIIMSAVLLLLIYGIYQLYSLFSKPFETERVISHVGEDTINAEGIFLKNETILNSSIGANADYHVSEGEKVAKDQVISVLYEGKLDTSVQNKINSLEQKISQLQAGVTDSEVFVTDLMKLDTMISDKITDILNSDSYGDCETAVHGIDELQRLLNKKSVVSGNTELINKEIRKLQNELSTLKSNSNHTLSRVISPAAGYFYTVYDGYENLLNRSKLTGLSVSQFNEFLSLKQDSERPKGYIGKIITDFTWTYTCLIDFAKADYFQPGDNLSIRFPRVSDESCDAVVKYISDVKDNKCVLILESNQLLDIVNTLRKENSEIILKKYYGYKVDKNAVKIVNGKTGIFVQNGQVIKFKPVDVKLNKNDYAIVTSSGKPEVLPTDDVIISGKDIYDGKIVE